ncbi:MAG: autotransporter-associated beta strand repeat-containing protein, partial [Verrucomicrobiales bacterium]|nr:autotransporter-associated beta strand repeat-containing protein [Verrucomicrobiales bacterium]
MKKTTSDRRKRWFFARSMARAYQEWLEKRSLNSKRTRVRGGVKSAKAKARPLFAEALEPRVLFSATPAPVEEAPPEEALQEATPQTSGELDSVVEGMGSITFDEGIEFDYTEEDVERLAQEAISRWEKSGLTAEQLEALESITYAVTDLEGSVIGAAEGSAIYLDYNAAGADWFVDDTEWLDEEFVEIDGILRAISGDDIDGLAFDGGASAGIDMLSVLMHEQGHILGLLDEYELGLRDSSMFGRFDEGERRIIEEDQAEGSEALSLEGRHFAEAESSTTLFTLDFEDVDGSSLFASGGNDPSSIDTTLSALGATNAGGAGASNKVWGMDTEFSTASLNLNSYDSGSAIAALNALPPGDYQLIFEYDQNVLDTAPKTGFSLSGVNGSGNSWSVHNVGYGGGSNQPSDRTLNNAFSHVAISTELNADTSARNPAILTIVAPGEDLTGASVFEQGGFSNIRIDFWNTSGGAAGAEVYYDNISLSAVALPAVAVPLVNLTFDADGAESGDSHVSTSNLGSLGGTATSTGAVEYGDGKIEGELAAQFDEDSNLVSYTIPAGEVEAGGDFTVAVNVYIDGNQAQFDRILDPFFRFEDNTTSVSFQTTEQAIHTTAPLSQGWHHLALTFDSDASGTDGRGVARAYVDGVQVAANTSALRPDFSAGLDLVVGNQANGTRPMTGLVDDVLFYDCLLLPGAVEAIVSNMVPVATNDTAFAAEAGGVDNATAGTPATGNVIAGIEANQQEDSSLLHQYTFSGTDPLSDKAGSGNLTQVTVGNATVNTDGEEAVFEGNDNGANKSYLQGTLSVPIDEMTLEFVITPTVDSGVSEGQIISTVGANVNRFYLAQFNDEIRLALGDAANFQTVIDASRFNLNEPTYVAIRFSYHTGTVPGGTGPGWLVDAFVGDVAGGDLEQVWTDKVFDTGRSNFTNWNGGWKFGSNAANSQAKWQGELDSVAFYDSQLTDEQIVSHFGAGPGDSDFDAEDTVGTGTASDLKVSSIAFGGTAFDGAINESQSVNGSTVIDGAYGTLTIEPDGSYSYVVNEAVMAGVNAADPDPADVFTYKIVDSQSPTGATNTATLTINVQSADDTTTTVYVDDNWAGMRPGADITDADLGTSAAETANFGINAFATLADALAVAGVDSTIIVNAGTYNETVALTGNQRLEITGPDAASEVFIASLSASETTTIAIEGSSTLQVGSAGDQTISASIEGNGNLKKVGAGALTLAGASANTFTGSTTLSEGTLILDKASSGTNALGGNVTVEDGTLRWNESHQIADSATLTQNGGSVLFSHKSETITHFNRSNGYTQTGGSSAIITVSDTLNMTGGSSFDINSPSTVIAETVVLTGGNLNIGGGGGTVQIGTGGLTMQGATISMNGGASQLILNGDLTTLPSGSTSRIRLSSGAFTSGGIDLGGVERTFTVADGSATEDLRIEVPILNGELTKLGDGLLLLAGDSAYVGNTNVNAGSLDVDGELKSAVVNVAGGATLTGGGIIDSAINGAAGSLITADGDLVLGDGSPDGFSTLGTFQIDSGYYVTILDSDQVDLGPVSTISGELRILKPGGAADLRVDIGQDSNGDTPLQDGFEGFSRTGDGSADHTQSYADDKLAGAGNSVDVSILNPTHYRDYDDIASGGFLDQSNLLSDSALRTSNGVMTLRLENLLDGDYEITTYHHNSRPLAYAMGGEFNLSVTDGVSTERSIATGLVESNDPTAPDSIITQTFRFTVVGGSTTDILLERTGGVGHMNLNGFDLSLIPPGDIAVSSGGSLDVDGRIEAGKVSLAGGSTLTGGGEVAAAIDGAAGSMIAADGHFKLGDGSADGFATAGELVVGRGDVVTFSDADGAELGTSTIVDGFLRSDSPALAVDFGRDSNGDDPLQDGFEGFNRSGDGNATHSQSYANETLAGAGNSVGVTIINPTHYRDYNSIASGDYVNQNNLLSDSVLTNGGGVMTLQLDNLLDGEYEITTYHHSTGNFESGKGGVFNLSVTDGVESDRIIGTGLTESVDPLSPVAILTQTFRFTVVQGSPVLIKLARTGGGHVNLNGFEIFTASTGSASLSSGDQISGTGTVQLNLESSGGSVLPGIDSGGSVAGSEIGTLVTRDVTFDSTSTLSFDFISADDGPSGHDHINVVGVVDLGGATLELNGTFDSTPAPGVTRLVLVSAGEGLTGEFKDLPEGTAVTIDGEVFTISYLNDEVSLTSAGTVETSVAISGTSLVLTDVNGAADSDDELTLTLTDNGYLITSNEVMDTPIPGAERISANEIFVSFADLTAAGIDRIDFDTRGGVDVLTLDFGQITNPANRNGASIQQKIVFLGGAGNGDELKITNGVFTTVVHNMTDGSSGTFDLDNDLDTDIEVEYSGLEPVDMTGSTATAFVFNLPAGADNAQLSQSGGIFTLESTDAVPTFESTDFVAPSDSITVNGAAGDVLTLSTDLDLSGSNTDLILNVESIHIDSAMVNTGTGDQSFAGAVTLGGNLAITANQFSATGSIDLAGNTWTVSVVDESTVDAQITSVGGGITVDAGPLNLANSTNSLDAAVDIQVSTGGELIVGTDGGASGLGDAEVFLNGGTMTLSDVSTPPALPTSANMQAWYDAGTITGLADGDLVTGWADQSGNGRDLVSYTGSPTLATDEINGQPAVRFNGNNENLQMVATATEYFAKDVFIVFRAGQDGDSATSNRTTFGPDWGAPIGVKDGNDNDRMWMFQGNEDRFWGSELPSGVRWNGIDIPSSSNFDMSAATGNASMGEYMVLNVTAGPNNGTQVREYIVGTRTDAWANSRFDTAEIIAYDNISAADRLGVEAYLMDKYYGSPTTLTNDVTVIGNSTITIQSGVGAATLGDLTIAADATININGETENKSLEFASVQITDAATVNLGNEVSVTLPDITETASPSDLAISGDGCVHLTTNNRYSGETTIGNGSSVITYEDYSLGGYDSGFTQVWQLGTNTNNWNSFSSNSSDEHYYFAGSYAARADGNSDLNPAADEAANTFERELSNSDPANSIHFNLPAGDLSNDFRLEMDFGTSWVPIAAIPYEVTVNGVTVFTGTHASDGDIRTVRFNGADVFATTGDNVIEIRRTDTDLGGRIGLDNFTLLTSPNTIANGGTTVEAGGALAIGGGTSVDEVLTISGTGNAKFGAAIVKQSGGNAALNGPITLAGDARIHSDNGNELSIRNGITMGAFDLTLDADSRINLDSPITGTGDLFVVGSDRVDFHAINSEFTGDVTVGEAGIGLAENLGRLDVHAKDGALGVGNTVTIANGSDAGIILRSDLDHSNDFVISGDGRGTEGAIRKEGGTGVLSGNVTMTGDASIYVYNGTLTIVNEVVGGGFTLSKTGSNMVSRLILNGSNPTIGNVTLDFGQLRILKSDGLGQTESLNVDSGEAIEFQLTGSATYDGSTALKTLNVDDGTVEVISGKVTLDDTFTLNLGLTGDIKLGGAGDLTVNTDFGNGTGTNDVNFLNHYGFRRDSGDAVFDLNNNGGGLNSGDPAGHSSYTGEALLTGALRFPDEASLLASGVFDTSISGYTDNFVNVWVGYLNTTETGILQLQRVLQDDWTGMWIDLDQDGVLESTSPGRGSNRGEQVAYNDGGLKTVNLTNPLGTGRYLVAFTQLEGGGNSAAGFQFKLPSGASLSDVNPGDPAQAGLWTGYIPVTIDNDVTKFGAGTTTLAGANSYNGDTTVQDGVLVVSHDTALGNGEGTVTVNNDATLAVDGGAPGIEITAASINLSGIGASGQSGVLVNVSGDNTIEGDIAVFGGLDFKIANDAAGTELTLNGSLNLGFSELTVDGAGDITLKGNISGAAPGSDPGPAAIPGLEAWYDASALTLSDGDLVTAWADQSGNGRDLVSYTGTPTFETNEINGNPAVRFNGNNENLQMEFPGKEYFAGDVYLVFRAGQDGNGATRTTFGPDWGAPIGVKDEDEADRMWMFQGNEDRFWGSELPSAVTRNGVSVSSANNFDMGGIDAGEYMVLQVAAGAANGTQEREYIVGTRTDAWSNARFDTAEVLAFDHALSTAERQYVENYLAVKYGIAGTFENSASVSFANDITKLGTGSLTLAGDNSYTGETSVEAGTLVVGHNNALGTVDGGTTVKDGAVLALDNTCADLADDSMLNGSADLAIGGETITLNGVGSGDGALVNVRGDNTIAASASILAEVVSLGQIGIGCSADTLTIDSNIDLKSSRLVANGSGDVVVNGEISGAGMDVGVDPVENSLAASQVFTNVAEANGYVLAYELIPDDGVNGSNPFPYAVNNTATVQPFDRVAYYLELDSGSGLEWVYVSMDAFTTDLAEIGIPNGSDLFVHQQIVNNMNVFASAGSGITTGTGLSTGNIEIWPSNYGGSNGNSIPNAGSGFDFGDSGASTSLGYGSFQIHNHDLDGTGPGTAGQTIFAYNDWRGSGDLGIGSQSSVDLDWTFSNNIDSYSVKRMAILVQELEPRVVETDNSLVKEGSGTLTLNAANTYNGGTTVKAGALMANNSSGSATGTGEVVVETTALLGGTGAVAGAVTATGGKIDSGLSAPADITDDLSTGDVTLDASSTFSVQLDSATPDTGYDQLDVTGSVDLGGAILDVTLNYGAVRGEKFTIIENDGNDFATDPVDGLFKDAGGNDLPHGAGIELNDGSGPVVFTLLYNVDASVVDINNAATLATGSGNDVVLVANGAPETSVEIVGNDLVITDIGNETADQLDISIQNIGGNDYYVVRDADTTLALTSSHPGALHGGANEIRILVSDVTGGLQVVTENAAAGTPLDTFTISSALTLGGDVVIAAEVINLEADVTATGTQTYDGSVDLDGNVTLTGEDVAFQSKTVSASVVTIDAGETLSVIGNLLFGERDTNGLITDVTVTGNGTLSVTGDSVEIGDESDSNTIANTTTVDLSGLGALSANVIDFRIGYGRQNRGTFTLSDTANTITADTVNVSDTRGQNSGSSTMILGAGSNVFNVDAFDLGISKGNGTVKFASQSAGSAGTLTIRAKDGVSGADITVGANTNAGTGAHIQGLLDLRGHDVDVFADALVIAYRTMPGWHSTISPAPNGQVSGRLLFDGGTFTANTVDMANRSGQFWNAATATIDISGGVFTINDTLSMTTVTDGRVAIGTINLSGGVLDLTDGVIPQGDGTEVFNFTGGTLKDVETIEFATTQQGGVFQVGADGAADDTTIAGDFTASGGSIEIQLDGTAGAGVAGGHDQIVVADSDGDGTVDLTGSTLDLVLNFAPAAGQSFVLIDNDTTADAVTGTFAGLPDDHVFELAFGGANYVFQIDYTTEDGTTAGNNVVLTSFGAADTSVEIVGGDLVISDINNESADKIDISVQNIGGVDYYVIKDTNTTPLALTTTLTAADANRVSGSEIHVKVSSVTGGLEVGTANPTPSTETDQVTISSLPADINGAVTINAEIIRVASGIKADSIALNGDVTLINDVVWDTSDANGSVSVTGTLNGGGMDLTLTTGTGNGTFSGAATGLDVLTLTYTGTIEFQDGFSSDSVYVALEGGDANLTVSGGDAVVGNGDGTGDVIMIAQRTQSLEAHTTGVFDVSAADSFTADVSLFQAGKLTNNTGGGDVTGTVNLSADNTVDASVLIMGQIDGGNVQTVTGNLNLGASNTFKVDTFIVGGHKGTGNVSFASAGTLSLDGLINAATDLRVGDNSDSITSSTARGTMDLSGGVFVADLDELVIGDYASDIAGAGAGRGSARGTLTIGESAGNSITANSVLLGNYTKNGTNDTTGGSPKIAEGTITMGGGSFDVSGDVVRGVNAGAAETFPTTSSSSVLIEGGTFTVSGNLAVDNLLSGKNGKSALVTVLGSSVQVGDGAGTELSAAINDDAAVAAVTTGTIDFSAAGTVDIDVETVTVADNQSSSALKSLGSVKLGDDNTILADDIFIGKKGSDGTLTIEDDAVLTVGTSSDRANLYVGYNGNTALNTTGVLDLGNAATFDAFLNTFVLGERKTVGLNGTTDGDVFLAAANNVDSTTVVISQSEMYREQPQSVLTLGAANTFKVDTFTVGGHRGNALVEFAAAGGVLTLSGSAGAETDLVIGETQGGTTNSTRGTIDLNGGTFNATLDLLDIAYRDARDDYNPVTNGVLSFDSGTVTANTVILGEGIKTLNGDLTTKGEGRGLGVLNVGGDAIFETSDVRMAIGTSEGSTGTVNQSGGEVDILDGSITDGVGIADYNLTGGILKDVSVLGFDFEQEGGTLQIGGDGEVDSMTVQGDFTASGGTIELQIDGAAGAGVAGGHDQILVADTDGDGALDLTGSTLDLTLNFAATAGQVFVLIDNDTTSDAITGTFTGMPEGHVFSLTFGGQDYMFQVRYNTEDGTAAGNNVVLESFGLAETSVEVVGGQLIITDINNDSQDDITITDDGTDYIVTDSSLVMFSSTAGVTVVDANTVRIPKSLVTAGLSLVSANGADTVGSNDTLTLAGPLNSEVDFDFGGAVTLDVETLNLEANLTGGHALNLTSDGVKVYVNEVPGTSLGTEGNPIEIEADITAANAHFRKTAGNGAAFFNGDNSGLSGTTTLHGSNARWALGTDTALGADGHTVRVGTDVDSGQQWFIASGDRTIASDLILDTQRFIVRGTIIDGSSSGTITIDGDVELSQTGVSDIFLQRDLTINGVISGTTGLEHQGGLVLTLTNAANSFTGGIDLDNSNGTLVVSNAGALGNAANTITFTRSATVQLDSDMTVPQSVVINPGVTGTIDTNGNDVVLNNTISGQGSLRKIGAGALSITQANTYEGGTTIGAGTVRVAQNTGFGSGVLTLQNGITITNTVNSNSPVTLANDVVVNGDFTTGELGFVGPLFFDGNVDLGATDRQITTINSSNNGNFAVKINGVISGAGGLTKAGSGFLNLGGLNTFAGGMTLDDGTLVLTSGNGDGLGSGTFTINGGTVAAQGFQQPVVDNEVLVGGDFSILSVNPFTFSNAIDLGGATRAITSVGSGNKIISGDISNGGLSLSTAAPSDFIFSGTNTYTGVTDIESGTLYVNGTHTGGDTYMVADGAVLGGTGSIDAEIVSSGIIAPGVGGAGDLATGNLNFGGEYIVDIDGTTTGDGAGNYDQLVVTGSVNFISSQPNVILVTDNAVSDQDTIDFLTSQFGANVTTGTFNALTFADQALLASADLVIVSRTTNSGNYDNGGGDLADGEAEVAFWEDLETPTILMSSFIARNSRWDWVDTGGLVNSASAAGAETTLTPAGEADSLFAGLGNPADIYSDNYDAIANASVGGGT